MPLEIKIDIIANGWIALWHRRASAVREQEWSEPILGHSPREVLLKFADTLQSRTQGQERK